jgi:hypothetical protein
MVNKHKDPNLGKNGKLLINFLATWNILRAFGIIHGHLVHFSGFGIMFKEKSGDPGVEAELN